MADPAQIPLAGLTIPQLLDLLAPLINQAARDAVNEAMSRLRIARYIGGTVIAVGSAGDTVICTPDDAPAAQVEATRYGGTAQVAGSRVLLVYTDKGATYALGTTP